MRYLRQSTTVTVTVGPFLDSTDGVTAEDALAGSMTVQIAKAGAAFANRNSATAIAFDADGFYRVELNATDTGTAGPLMLKSRVAGAAPVWHEFTIMSQARYDLAILGTGVQPVNLTQIDGLATNANLATLNLKQLNIVNNAGSALVASSTGSNGNGIAASGNGSGAGCRIVGGVTGHGIDAAGGVTSGAGIRAGATASGNGISAIGAGATGHGLSCTGAGDGHGLYASGGGTSGNGINAETPSPTGHGIRARATSGTGSGFHATGVASGIFASGYLEGHGIHAQGGWTSGNGALCEGYPNLDVDQTGGHGLEARGGVVGGDGIRATAIAGSKALGDAAVDSILDRAIAEPASIWPWANASLRTIIGWLGVLSRNKITQTATTQTVRNDADGADIASSTHADDGSQHTRGKFS